MAVPHSSLGSPSTDGERRRSFRRNVPESHLATATLGTRGSALILDVSEGGLGLQSAGPLTVGASTPLRFSLPHGGLVEGNGMVAWSDVTGRAGIRLVSLATGARLALSQWVQGGRNKQNAMVDIDKLSEDPVGEALEYLANNHLDEPAAFAYLVQKAPAETGAEGAALALQDGSGMVCRASVGTAPGVGVRLQGSSGLTGECIRSASIVRCDDTDTDPRADRMLCRRINLRSTVIVPVSSSGAVIGVLETLSSRPRAFDSAHVRYLRGFADLVATTIRPDAAPVPAPAARAVEIQPPAIAVAEMLPRAATVSTQGSAAAAAPAFAPAPVPVRAAAAPVIVPEPPISEPEPSFVPARSSSLGNASRSSAAVAVAKTLSHAPSLEPRRVSRTAMMVVAAAAFAMAAGGAYLGFRSPASDTSVVHASAPAATPSQPAAATSTPPATPTVTTTQLALPGGAGAGKTAPPAPSSASPSARREEESSSAPLSLREPTDVSVRDVRQEVASVAPPTLTMGAAASPSLPNLPSTMPEVQPRVSGGITEAKLIHRVDPSYPDVARQMHIEGNVEIRAVVAHDGQIKNPVAVSGPPMLRAAALDAVRKWRYEPSKLDGQPTDRDLLITISFHLPR